MNNEKPYTAIALQGGGALGAYEYGVMKELFESRGPDFKPAVITGISIGAINAAILAGADKPIETLDHIWRDIFALPIPMPPSLERVYESFVPHPLQQFFSVIGNEGMYRFRPESVMAPFITNSIYDTSPLRETLRRHVDLDRLNSSYQVVVTALNVETGQLAKFGNAISIAMSIEGDGKYANDQGLTIDHIVASGSLPPGFPMTAIDGSSGSYYWDGGIVSNTPLSEAINCLEKCGSGSRDVKRELIVSELLPMRGDIPQSIDEVMSRFFNLIFSSKLDLDATLFRKYSQFVDLIQDIDLLIKTIEGNDMLKDEVNRALASTGTHFTTGGIQNSPGFKKLIDHRRIDAFTLIPFTAGRKFRNAGDFSKASIEARIDAGQKEARKRNIGQCQFLTFA